jgi:DNA-binding transcriptional MerR regulator
MSEEKQYTNSPAKRAGNRRYYERNKEKVLDYVKEWRADNREHWAAYLRGYRQRQKEKKRAILFQDLPFAGVSQLEAAW